LPSSPQKGDSLSDPCFILGPTASSSSSPLHRVFSSHSSNHSIGQSSLSPSPLQVLKRGIVSNSPIHAFILDPSPKHFVRIILVCRPLVTLSTSKVFVLGIQLPYSPPHRFFFRASSLDLSSNSRYLKNQESRLTVITAFFSNSCSPLESRQELAWGNVGTPLLKRGIEGYREERNAEPGEGGSRQGPPRGSCRALWMVMQTWNQEEAHRIREGMPCVPPPRIPLGSRRSGSPGVSRPRKNSSQSL
jgi:hypothetical protein